MKVTPYLFTALIVVSVGSCKKKETTTVEVSKQAVLQETSANVINASYTDLSNKATALYDRVTAFNASTSSANLEAARQAWRDVRTVYEQTEGFLFGPMSTADIDPRVDTWPIDFDKLDSVLASSSTPSPITAAYVDGLAESLKGFHPIEYFLFGQNGNKAVSDFTPRQKEYLLALCDNLKGLCGQVKAAWDNGYTSTFDNPGSGNSTYPTVRAAYEEVIKAMADICDEVAGEKMKTPFDQKDPTQEESPFSKNSMVDFTNNIKSVQNMYLGKYTTDGKGLEDLIKANNISMDGSIKQKINASLTALGNINVPFGQAISDGPGGQRIQVQNAMTAIAELHDYLEGDVTAYLKTITN